MAPYNTHIKLCQIKLLFSTNFNPQSKIPFINYARNTQILLLIHSKSSKKIS